MTALTDRVLDYTDFVAGPVGIGAALAVVNALEQEGLIRRYAIGGAVAVMFHAEPVLTYDLDVFVLVPSPPDGLIDLGPLYRRLQSAGGRIERETIVVAEIPVQLIPAYNALVEEGVEQAGGTEFDGTPTRVIGYEHLLAIMVQTGRPKDRERLASLVAQRPPEPARLGDILDRHGLADRWRELMQDR